MDAELKRKWVTALRSGEYKQGKGALRERDCYCVVGVLCDVSGRGSWCSPDSYGRWAYTLGDSFSRFGLCREVMNDAVCKGTSYLTFIDLMNRNDDGISFHELADYIEANV